MTLSNYKRWLTLGFDEFIAENKINIIEVTENLRYEKITPATRVRLADDEFFFFGPGTLRLVYISNETLAERLWHDFKNSLGHSASEKTVRSRAGKTSNQLIFASHGFTVSLNGDGVDFIEIYSPCSVQKYLDNVYQEPGLFIR